MNLFMNLLLKLKKTSQNFIDTNARLNQFDQINLTPSLNQKLSIVFIDYTINSSPVSVRLLAS